MQIRGTPYSVNPDSNTGHNETSEMGENERIRHRIHPHQSGRQVEASSHSSFDGFADFVVSTSVFGVKTKTIHTELNARSQSER